MNINLVDSVSSVTNGNGALEATRMNNDSSKFLDLVQHFQNEKKSTLSSSQVIESGKINGDVSSNFSGSFSLDKDKNASVVGAAANQGNVHSNNKNIDKTSKLYEKSMELESYFVKQILSSMRKTVSKSSLGEDNFAGQMYEDMLYDEYATSMTKNAGFGLADQIYLSIAK